MNLCETTQGAPGLQYAVWKDSLASYPSYEEARRFTVEFDALKPNVSYTFFVAVFAARERRVVAENDGVVGDKPVRRGEVIAIGSPLEPAQKEGIPVCLARVVSSLNGPERPRGDMIRHQRLDDRPPAPLEDYFDIDVGVVGGVRSRAVGLVAGTHLYLLPHRPSHDLLDPALRGFWRQAGQRLSLYGGIVPVVFQKSTGVPVENTSALGVPVVGVGLRGAFYWRFPRINDEPFYRDAIQPFRLTVGRMWYRQKDANPLVERRHLKRDVYVGLTADVELRQLLGPFARLFGL